MTTTVTSSNTPSLAGVPVTLKAAVAAAGGVAIGSVTFKDGATTLGTVSLVAGVATFTTSTLAVGTHSITAVYGGATGFTGSTSPAFSQVISPAGALKISFNIHALADNTSKPKVVTMPVPNALVKVFSTANSCVGNIFNAIDPKKWGKIFDGADGPGGVDGCAPISVGSYLATGTTDVNGQTTIMVPPLSLNWTTQYVVIGRATNALRAAGLGGQANGPTDH